MSLAGEYTQLQATSQSMPSGEASDTLTVRVKDAIVPEGFPTLTPR